MYNVMISTIDQDGVKPQFKGSFARKFQADDYVKMWRQLAVENGFLIRVDRSKDEELS